MRTTSVLAPVTLAAAASIAAPAERVPFTKPLWDRPADLEQFVERWPQAPSFKSPLLQAEAEPVIVLPPDTDDAPPEENHLHRGPTSEEWHCLVPLQQAAPPSTAIPAPPNRCKTPSLEPDQLFHLL